MKLVSVKVMASSIPNKFQLKSPNIFNCNVVNAILLTPYSEGARKSTFIVSPYIIIPRL